MWENNKRKQIFGKAETVKKGTCNPVGELTLGLDGELGRKKGDLHSTRILPLTCSVVMIGRSQRLCAFGDTKPH